MTVDYFYYERTRYKTAHIVVNREGKILYDLSKLYDNEMLVLDKQQRTPLSPSGGFIRTNGLNSFSIAVLEAVSGLMQMFGIPDFSIDRSRYLDIVYRHMSQAPRLNTIRTDLLAVSRVPSTGVSLGQSCIGMGKAITAQGRILQSGVLSAGVIPSKYAQFVQELQGMAKLAKEWIEVRDVYAALLLDSAEQDGLDLSCLTAEDDKRLRIKSIKSMHHATWYIAGYSASAAIVEAAEKIEFHLEQLGLRENEDHSCLSRVTSKALQEVSRHSTTQGLEE
jgi:hypothetical protein